jgi:hypothetical protein
MFDGSHSGGGLTSREISPNAQLASADPASIFEFKAGECVTARPHSKVRYRHHYADSVRHTLWMKSGKKVGQHASGTCEVLQIQNFGQQTTSQS